MMRRGGIFVPELNYGSVGEGISDDVQGEVAFVPQHLNSSFVG